MEDHFQIFPVGIIRKRDRSAFIEIYKKYGDALVGLHQYSHIIVCSWFHENDTSEKRNVLKVHPRGNKANPLRGVFATRSPMRPNLIGLFSCRIMTIKDNVIQIERIEAFDGSPVLDIKPYIPRLDSIPDAQVPAYKTS